MLGYLVLHLKIQPDPECLQPLRELPVPSTKKKLLRVLSMFSYYARWISYFNNRIKSPTKACISLIFPLPSEAIMAFISLKCELESACLLCVKESIPFTVKCDASEYTIAATLNQGRQPVAFTLKHLDPLSYVIPSKKLQQLLMQSKSEVILCMSKNLY